jgi:cytoplasmic tRNA 2-thiolation protein 2
MAKLRFASSVKRIREMLLFDTLCIASTWHIPVSLLLLTFYARACFFPLIETRFRKSLEPSINVIPDGPRRKGLTATGSLVIAFSGGTNSTTLLDLVAKTYFAPRTDDPEKLKGGKKHPRNTDKSVWKGRPAVCFVEVCGAFPGVCCHFIIRFNASSLVLEYRKKTEQKT